MAQMARELVLLSPEKTILSFPLAGIGSRFLAHFLDAFILMFVMMGIQFGLGTLAAMGGRSSIVLAISRILLVLGPFAYFILLEGLWNGQTLGKKAARIQVRMADGTPVTFGATVGRNFLRVADFLPSFYFAGLIACFTNPNSQRLGDLVANTIVVHLAPPIPRMGPAPHTAGTHALEHLVPDVSRMTLEEYNVVKRLADRFPQFSNKVQEQKVRDVWNPIAAKHRIPPIAGVHPVYLMEAVVMKYGREKGLL